MLQKVIERAELRIMGQRQQREQQARWRAERAKQEKELQESERSDRREPPNQIHDLSQQTEQAHWGGETVQQVKELREPELSTREPIIEQQKEEKIRKAREQRLTEEPVSGIKIIIRTSDGERMERLFKDTAFFQEVYDWVGSSNRMPLYFTIQRGSIVVKHTERLQSNEVLDISERDEDEIKVTLNNSEVSFFGQFQDSKEDLSETINDTSSCQPHPITASYKTASVESAAQLVLPCCTASSGKSTFGADSSQAKAQVKRKRKDNRTRKYKREKRKQDDNN
ncbi:uncharacterized protein LOC141888901 isoform X4 [Acropora palmata]|uniref:uncharacterized protein LOC141888901 isoform X4 n=1 Tax=Acropora palmata TaxID=6131 RepID=UPI003D9FCAC7